MKLDGIFFGRNNDFRINRILRHQLYGFNIDTFSFDSGLEIPGDILTFSFGGFNGNGTFRSESFRSEFNNSSFVKDNFVSYIIKIFTEFQYDLRTFPAADPKGLVKINIARFFQGEFPGSVARYPDRFIFNGYNLSYDLRPFVFRFWSFIQIEDITGEKTYG